MPADAYLGLVAAGSPVTIAPDYFLALPDGYIFSRPRIIGAWEQCWLALKGLVEAERCTRVVAMCGMPAVGKSTWVTKHSADYGDAATVVFFDDLFLTTFKRQMWWDGFRSKAGASAAALPVEIVVVQPPSLEAAIASMRARAAKGGHAVPEDVMGRFHAEFEMPRLDEGFERVRVYRNDYDNATGAGDYVLLSDTALDTPV